MTPPFVLSRAAFCCAFFVARKETPGSRLEVSNYHIISNTPLDLCS